MSLPTHKTLAEIRSHLELSITSKSSIRIIIFMEMELSTVCSRRVYEWSRKKPLYIWAVYRVEKQTRTKESI